MRFAKLDPIRFHCFILLQNERIFAYAWLGPGCLSILMKERLTSFPLSFRHFFVVNGRIKLYNRTLLAMKRKMALIALR
jgi:hypothetical protein